ncbi:MAG: Ldh family oxidoreductase [Anaerolineae bacterium]
MAEGNILVHANALESYATSLLAAAGLTDEDAAFTAHALVQTNLWGIDSHGVLRLPLYVKRLRNGAMNPRPHIQPVRGALALQVIDGDDGPGFIVGREAMRKAIAIAEQFNVGVVGAIRSNHFGATGLYARLAAERGMVGIAMTNVVPNMVAPGGGKPITGNNPIAIAIPTFADFPFVLDMSLSAVAGGKLLLASKQGVKIPLDWATDRDGRPTDDPDKAFAGSLLPMAGFKGLGLSYAVDILCGLITGGAFGDAMKGMYTHPNEPSQTGHMMIAINLAAIISEDEMREKMRAFYTSLKNSPMWDSSAEMFMPGEIEYRLAQKRQAEGIPLPAQLYAEMEALGAELGIPDALARA